MTAKKAPLKLNRSEIVKRLRERADEAMTQELGLFDTNAFGQKIVRDLDKARNDVVWWLLGLDNKWGKWEIDHCNGRSSVFTEYMTDATRDVVAEWVNTAVTEVLAEQATKMRTDIKKAIAAELTKIASDYRVGCSIRGAVDERVHAIVNETADELFADIIDEEGEVK